jgi:DNA-binding GntR family transcriptional regulator
VREAVKALVAVGLVEARPRQGLVVATISIPMLGDVPDERRSKVSALNSRRGATASERSGLRQILERLIAALAEGPPAPFYDVNTEFHELLYDAAHAQFIAGQTRSLRRRVVAYRRYVTCEPGRMTTISEPGRILEAIERADVDGAFRGRAGTSTCRATTWPTSSRLCRWQCLTRAALDRHRSPQFHRPRQDKLSNPFRQGKGRQ